MTDKEKKSIQMKNQTRRQASYIPRVVTELELFVNLITKLGKKCKVIVYYNFDNNINQRDNFFKNVFFFFRIKI